MEIRLNQELGRIERVYDVYPYPREEVHIVISDMVALSLAAAKPEEKDQKYLKDSEAPILWHFTSANISTQGRWLEKIVEEICLDIKPNKIRVIWMPIHKSGEPINYVKDILDIADILLKIKVIGRKAKVSVRTALAKTWLPKHVKNQVIALKLQRLNLAMEVLAYYWFRCRCIDLTKLTMIRVKKDTVVTDETKMEIPGFEGFVFNPRAYRNLDSDPMEVSFFTGRRAREIMRRVLTVHGVEPNWERAHVAIGELEKVTVPQVMDKGKPHVFSAPQAGGEAANRAMISRVRTQADFELGLSEINTLQDTGLYKYFWEGLNIQSTRDKVTLDPYKRDPIARGNLIPFTILPTTQGKPVQAYPVKSLEVKPTSVEKAKDGPKEREVNTLMEAITTYFVTAPAPAPEPKRLTPIQDRLGPRVENSNPEEKSSSSQVSREMEKSNSSQVTQEMETEENLSVLGMIEEIISEGCAGTEEKREESVTESDVSQSMAEVTMISATPRSRSAPRSPAVSPILPRTSTPKASRKVSPEKPKSSRKTREVSPEKPRSRRETKKTVPEVTLTSSSEESEDEASDSSSSSDSSSEEETEGERIKRWAAMISLMEDMDRKKKEKKKRDKKEKEREKKLKQKKKQRKTDN